MKNSEEDILKRFLQDTFSDYEPEPTEQAWEHIFAAIQPAKPSAWSSVKPLITSVLLVLTSLWLWYSSSQIAEANSTELALREETKNEELKEKQISNNIQKLPVKTQTTATQPSDDIQTNISSLSKLSVQIQTREAELSVKTQTTERERATESSVKTQTTETQPSDDSQTNILSSPNVSVQIQTRATEWSGKTQTTETKTQPSDDSQTNISPLSKLSVQIQTRVTESSVKTQTTEVMETPQSDDSQTNVLSLPKVSVETPIVANDSKEFLVDNNTPKEEAGTHPTVGRPSDVGGVRFFSESPDNNAVIELVRHIRPIESLSGKDFILSKVVFNSPQITPIEVLNQKIKPVRQHSYISLSITPLQTYRILTVNNREVQNVQTNQLFDSERNGWQFDLGLVKPIGKLWNLRTNLSYLKMRQWSEYQINTDEILLRNTNSIQRPNTIETVGQLYTESQTLQLVGLKMDVQKFFKITGKNQYFVSTGTQLMYESTQKQSHLFLNVSAGFQHVVGQNCFLTVEPTASYSLNNFNNSQSLIQANGYNLGLKVGVNFRVK